MVKNVKLESLASNKYYNKTENISTKDNSFERNDNYSEAILQCLRALLIIDKQIYHANLNNILNLIFNEIDSKKFEDSLKNESSEKKISKYDEDAFKTELKKFEPIIRNKIKEIFENSNSNFDSSLFNEILETIKDTNKIVEKFKELCKKNKTQENDSKKTDSEKQSDTKSKDSSSKSNVKENDSKKTDSEKQSDTKSKDSSSKSDVKENIDSKKANSEKTSDTESKDSSSKSDVKENIDSKKTDSEKPLEIKPKDSSSKNNDDLNEIKIKLLRSLKKQSKKYTVQIFKLNAFVLKKSFTTVLFFPFKVAKLYYKTFFKKTENEKSTFFSTLMKLFLLDKRVIFWTTVFVTHWFKKLFTILSAIKKFTFRENLDKEISDAETKFKTDIDEMTKNVSKQLEPEKNEIIKFINVLEELNKWYLAIVAGKDLIRLFWDRFLKGKMTIIVKKLFEWIKKKQITNIILKIGKNAPRLAGRAALALISNPFGLALVTLAVTGAAVYMTVKAYNSMYNKPFTDYTEAHYTHQIEKATDFGFDEPYKTSYNYFSNDLTKNIKSKEEKIITYEKSVGKVTPKYVQMLTTESYDKVISEINNKILELFKKIEFFKKFYPDNVEDLKNNIFSNIETKLNSYKVFEKKQYSDNFLNEDSTKIGYIFNEKNYKDFLTYINRILRAIQIFDETILNENGLLAANLSDLYNKNIKNTNKKNKYTDIIYNNFFESFLKPYLGPYYIKENVNIFENIRNIIKDLSTAYFTENKKNHGEIFKVSLSNILFDGYGFDLRKKTDAEKTVEYFVKFGEDKLPYSKNLFFYKTGFFGDETEKEYEYFPALVYERDKEKAANTLNYRLFSMNPFLSNNGFYFLTKNSQNNPVDFLEFTKEISSGHHHFSTPFISESSVAISEENFKNILKNLNIETELPSNLRDLNEENYKNLIDELRSNEITLDNTFVSKDDINFMKALLITLLEEMK